MRPGCCPIQIKRFLLPKDGIDRSECEDAIGINIRANRFAIADGATEAFDSRRWAKLLVRNWVRTEPSITSPDQFQVWIAGLGEQLHNVWSGWELSWYAEEKARAGSSAAFVGIQFYNNKNLLLWKAIALGDSCLVRRRGDIICDSLPLSDSKSFGSRPILVPSLVSVQERVIPHLSTRSGEVERGDVFLLLTDAVAAWYLSLWENHDPIVADFDSLLISDRHHDLVKLLEQERLAHKLRNDDIAILRISFQ